MNSHEPATPYGRWAEPARSLTPRPFPHSPEWSPGPGKPPVREDSLKSGQVQIERKSFLFSLKENPRGRLLRITEDIGGRYNSIIIPASGLNEFKKLLEEMIQASEEQPLKPTPSE
jgi:hypothetical protein